MVLKMVYSWPNQQKIAKSYRSIILWARLSSSQFKMFATIKAIKASCSEMFGCNLMCCKCVCITVFPLRKQGPFEDLSAYGPYLDTAVVRHLCGLAPTIPVHYLSMTMTKPNQTPTDCVYARTVDTLLIWYTSNFRRTLLPSPVLKVISVCVNLLAPLYGCSTF